MRLITLLIHCHHCPGFVYEKARLCRERGTIEINVWPRRGAKPICSSCHRPAPGCDHLGVRAFEFVPFWGFMVILLYRMRRVDCTTCGVKVEQLPWATGKHQLTRAYMLFLAHWARQLSWQETAIAFRTSWDKVCQAVDYVVAWGLEHSQRFRLRELLRYNLKTVRAYLLKEDFQQFWEYNSPTWAAKFLHDWCHRGLAPRADEKGRQNPAQSPRTHPQLFPRQKTVVQRRRRGASTTRPSSPCEKLTDSVPSAPPKSPSTMPAASYPSRTSPTDSTDKPKILSAQPSTCATDGPGHLHKRPS
jgi:hypothetical protein